MQVKRETVSKRQKSLQRALKGAVSLFLVLVMILGVVLPNVREVQAVSTRVADTDTSNTYLDERFLGHPYSTEFAGRIWTDKSVNTLGTGEEDFQVTYSALATAKSVTGQTASPLDIVFVIDISGSMVDEMSNRDDTPRIDATVDALNASIEEVMNMNPYTRVAVVAFSSTSTVLLPLGRYTEGSRGAGNNRVTDYFSVSDDSDTLYMHVYREGATQQTTSDKSVTGGTNIQRGYYEGLNILASRTDVTADINGTTINRVPAMIFLSDGAPTYSSDSTNWWAPANNGNDGPGSNPSGNTYFIGNGFKALLTGAYMKEAVNRVYNVDVSVHTVGMGISGLSGHEQNLAYMTLAPNDNWNATNNVATDIKSAWSTYTTNNGSPSVNVGAVYGSYYYDSSYTVSHPTSNDIDTNRNALKEFVDDYHDADSATEVVDVFDTIVGNISISAPEVPTEVKLGATLENSGYLTYTDPIGHYMEVKNIRKLTYNGTDYINPVSRDERVNGVGTVTYTFSAAVTGSDERDTNLNKILITITTDADGHQVLKVQVPAALIPLRVNTVELDTTGKVLSHTHNNEQPLRLIYTVGLRDDVYDRTAGVIIQNPTGTYFATEEQKDAYQAYLVNNKAEDGTSKFYSNLYTGKTIEGKTVGNATVEFEPSHTNNFYYIQENMPVFYDEAMTRPVRTTNLVDGDTYYYKEIYYHNNEVVTKAVARTGAQLENTAIQVVNGQLVRLPGSPRLNKILLFEGTKTDADNKTKTAKESYEPTFVQATGNPDPYEGRFVVYLGNNGMQTVKTAGSLEISKEVVAEAGLTPSVTAFTFTVDFTDAPGSYDYTVVDAAGNPVLDANGKAVTGTISDGGTITLTDGQTAQIVNLPPDAKYEVTEKEANSSGFTTTVTGDEGTIVAGKVSKAEFVNEYKADPVTFPAEKGLGGVKKLEGRPWTDKDAFTFFLTPYNNAPLPEGYDAAAGVTVTSDDVANGEAVFEFGSIKFTVPGTYRYTIVEKEPEDHEYLPGMTYSRALYRLVIEVEDNGSGQLVINDELTSLQRLYTDDAQQLFSYDAAGNIVMNKGYEAEDEVVFINKYEAGSVVRTPVATKTYTDKSGNNPLLSGMFEFRFTPVGEVVNGSVVENSAATVPMPLGNNNQKLTEVITSNEGRDVTFLPITFTNADLKGKQTVTYRYMLEEVLPTSADGTPVTVLNGMTYDDTEIYVDVTLSINASSVDDAALLVDSVYSNGQRLANFTNVYEPAPVEAVILGEKQINRDLNPGEEFQFTLTAANNAASEVIAAQTGDGKVAATATISGTTRDFSFVNSNGDGFTFTAPGTYVFYVDEVEPADAEDKVPGVTYDTHTSVVTIVVSDTKDSVTDKWTGQLQIESITYDNSTVSDDTTQAVFVNTYNTVFDDETTINLSGKKVLEGRPLKENEFFFTITAVNNAPMGDSAPANPASADGTISLLQNVKYTTEGTYEYLIRENVPADGQKLGGVTYDENTVYKVVVTVNDNNEGKLQASYVIYKSTDKGVTFAATPVDTIKFNNTYDASDTTYKPIALEKDLYGRELEAGEFTFVVTDVTDYAADPALKDGMVLPEVTEVTNAADGTITFDNVTFTKPGIYRVQITEKIPADDEKLGGVTYSDNIFDVTFTVKDNGNGALEVTRTYTGSRTFVNEYETTGTLDGKTNLKVIKNFTGRAWETDDVFTFVLKPSNEAAINGVADGSVDMNGAAQGTPESMTIAIAGTDAVKEKAFSDIVFTKADTYEFTLYEDAETAPITGVNYDTALRTVTVVADDNGDGTMTVTSTVTGGTGLTFNNVYDPDETTLYGWDNLQVTKELTGREWLETDAFTFTLEVDPTHAKTVEAVKSEEGNLPEVILPAQTEITMTSENRNTLSFGDIRFDAEGTYQFLIKEKVPAEAIRNEDGTYTLNGVTYDASVMTVVVTVINDSASGTLKVASKTVKDSLEGNVADGKIHFVNTYSSEKVDLTGTTYLEVNKKLVGRDWNENDSFTFTIEGSGDKTLDEIEAGNIILPDETSITISGGSGNTRTGAFGDITFKKEGIFYFLIKEVNDQKSANMTYDSHEVLVRVDVADNKEGALVVAAPTYSGEMTFINTFQPDPTTLTLKGVKTLEGRDYKEGDVFTFTISADEGIPMPALTKVTATNTISATERAIEFGPIVYRQEGTYTYTIKEIQGGIADKGVIFDDNEWYATVTVTYDSAEGKFNRTVTYTDKNGVSVPEGLAGDFIFTNTYDADDTDPVSVAVKKVVTAVDGNSYTMQGGEFTYKLEPSADNPIDDPVKGTATVTNAADGNINLFSGVIYTAPGTYEYTVYEADTTQEPGIDYDAAYYTIQVEVEDDQNGKLQATVTIKDDAGVISDDGITFNNIYDPDDATAIIYGQKNLTGRELIAGDFTFALVPVDTKDADGNIITPAEETPMPASATASNNATGHFGFDQIVYSVHGTYSYQVMETSVRLKGITYDTSVYDVVVKVIDMEGVLQASIEYYKSGAEVDAVVFDNVYSPKSVNVTVSGDKLLTGRDLREGEFEFRLVDKNNVDVDVVSNTADGTFTLTVPEITEAGEYRYIVIEKITPVEGITFDLTAYTVVIDVEDVDAELVADVTVYKGEDTETKTEDILVANTYKPAPATVQLSAAKVLDGRKQIAGEFEFELRDEAGNVIDTAANNEAGVVEFEAIMYDMAGTYTYTIAEKAGTLEHVTYDTATYEVTVTVSDDLNGHLVAEVSTDGKALVFTNTYTEPPVEPVPTPEPTPTPTPESTPTPTPPEGGGSVNTGDAANVAGFIAMAVIALGAIYLQMLYFKKEQINK